MKVRFEEGVSRTSSSFVSSSLLRLEVGVLGVNFWLAFRGVDCALPGPFPPEIEKSAPLSFDSLRILKRRSEIARGVGTPSGLFLAVISVLVLCSDRIERESYARTRQPFSYQQRAYGSLIFSIEAVTLC